MKRQTLEQFLFEVYLPKNPQVGEEAAKQYRCACRHFDTFVSGDVSMRAMTVDHVADCLQAISDTGRANRTVNNCRQILLTLWQWAYELDLKDDPPPTKRRLPKLREPKIVPNSWTLEQMATLKEACLAAKPLPRFKPYLWTGQHWWALCSLIWDTGHRVTALLKTPRDALDSDGYLHVSAEDTKHFGEMVHKLKPSTIALIESLSDGDLLLHWPKKPRQLWVCFERDVLVPSGLPYGARHKFHCIRRTSASHLYAATGSPYDAMAHLGHTRIETTWGYLDPKITGKKKAAAKLLPEIGDTGEGNGNGRASE